jgi:hypothetical protein
MTRSSYAADQATLGHDADPPELAITAAANRGSDLT